MAVLWPGCTAAHPGIGRCFCQTTNFVANKDLGRLDRISLRSPSAREILTAAVACPYTTVQSTRPHASAQCWYCNSIWYKISVHGERVYSRSRCCNLNSNPAPGAAANSVKDHCIWNFLAQQTAKLSDKSFFAFFLPGGGKTSEKQNGATQRSRESCEGEIEKSEGVLVGPGARHGQARNRTLLKKN